MREELKPEWKRDGRVVYKLYETGRRYNGEPVVSNAATISVSVDWDFSVSSAADADRLAQEIADYLNTRAKPPQGDVGADSGLAAADDNHKVLVEAAMSIVQCDDDAAGAKGKVGATLNGYGLCDLFDSIGHPFGSGEHKQHPYRSVNLAVALIDLRRALAAFQSRQEEK